MSKASNSPASGPAGNRQRVTGPADGEPIAIRTGFTARSFRAQAMGPGMDPLVMVDHYVMTEDTFGTHPHAGMSAVSLLFEESEGRFHNRDSLGNDFDLLPGDLYWLMAGRGALHNEYPREGSRIHGLQVFVNVPQESRYAEPSSLLVRREDMPIIRNSHYNVRVALGVSNGVVGTQSPGLPMNILDGQLAPKGNFEHEIASGQNAWVHCIGGEIEVTVAGNNRELRKGQVIAIDNSENKRSITVQVSATRSQAHFVLLNGHALKEPYVQQGPFVMSSQDEINAIKQAFNEGQFGSID